MAPELDPPCVVCRHKKVVDIDVAQSSNIDELTIAQRFGVTKVALRKHLSHKSAEAGKGALPNRAANVVELRPCPVCTHGNRSAIELAVASGLSWLDIGRVHGISGSSIRVHAEQCIKDTLRRASQEAATKQANKSVKERCRDLLAVVEQLIQQAATDEEASYRDRAALITSAKGSLELLGRLTGEIGPAAEILVIDSPRWKRIEAKIAAALAPYPEAARAVAKALEDMEAA